MLHVSDVHLASRIKLLKIDTPDCTHIKNVTFKKNSSSDFFADPIQILLRWVVVAGTSWVRLTKGGQSRVGG